MRSGTTMLGAMLGSHPMRITTPETIFKLEILEQLNGRELGNKSAFWRYFDQVEQSFRYTIWGVAALKDELKKELQDKGTEAYSFRYLMEWFVKQYGEQKLTKCNADTWIDHSPHNIRCARLLLNYYPDARFVHIFRDGRGVACSYFNIDWGPCTINTAASYWAKNLYINIEKEKLIPKEKLFHVSYEDLVTNPQETLKKLCGNLEIEFLPEMIEGRDFVAPSYTMQQHSLVGSRPKSNKGESWRSVLSDRQIEIFESIAGESLKQLNYPLLYDTPRPISMWETFQMKRAHKVLAKKKACRNEQRKQSGIAEGIKQIDEYLKNRPI